MKKRLICALLSLALLVSVLPSISLTAKAKSNLKTSDALVNLLKTFEGFSGACIKDGTQRSVGYGSRCDMCDPNAPGYPNNPCTAYTTANPISVEHATELLRKFLGSFETAVNSFADKYNLTFTQQQFDALISFTYNCGAGWTSGYGASGGLEKDNPYALHNALINKNDALVAYAIGTWKTFRERIPSTGHVQRRMLELDVYFNNAFGNGYTAWPNAERYVYLDGNGGQVKYAFHAFDINHPTSIVTEFSSRPVGMDANDNLFTYEFAGWFTQRVGGTQVTELNSSIKRGTTLYAQWKNPAGEIVTLANDMPAEQPVNVKVTVTQWWDLTIYENPGQHYAVVREAAHDEKLTITKITTGYDRYKTKILFGFCGDGWIKLSVTNYNQVGGDDYQGSEPEDDTVPGTWYKVLVDALNVRSQPVTGAANVVGSKKSGDRVKIVKTQSSSDGNLLWGQMSDGNWICVKYYGEDYAVADGTTATPPSAPTPEVKKYTVTFQNYDGKTITSNQYVENAAVVIPADPTRPVSNQGEWVFIGWDKPVTNCTGNATYTAQYKLKYAIGDIDRNGKVNEDDAIYLLRNVLSPELYAIGCKPDFNADGKVNEDDAIYLLRHVLSPELYKLEIK